ncbi:MAG: peptidoglycan-binding protein [Deltaproteobacteria bacterium]|nr:peptidoglycan-binding protein [Deltaproteobacteria bacterium]
MTTRAIEASAQARGVSEETRPTSAPSPHLQAQQLLNQFYSGAQLPEHGRPDAETRQALRDFQHTRGLDPSGEPDAATLEEFGVNLNELREEALAEFQRRTFEEVAPHVRRYEVAVD